MNMKVKELINRNNHMCAIYDVYGADGHRQRASFGESTIFHTTSGADIVCLCEEDTHTNEYVRMIIYAPNKLIAENELEMQLSDGFFENCRVGNVVEHSHESYGDALFEVIIKTYNWGVDRYEAVDTKRAYDCSNDVVETINGYTESEKNVDLIEFEVYGYIPQSYRLTDISNWLFEVSYEKESE